MHLDYTYKDKCILNVKLSEIQLQITKKKKVFLSLLKKAFLTIFTFALQYTPNKSFSIVKENLFYSMIS